MGRLGGEGVGVGPTPSCTMDKSVLLCTPALTRSFHILPSFYVKTKKQNNIYDS